VITLLDTHVVIWLATADPKLGKRTRGLIDAAVAQRALAFSAISLWEIAMLVARGRLQTTLPVEELRNRLLQTGMTELPLTGDVALLSAQLALHGDPADRFIAASAVSHAAVLVTADERLLGWKHALKRQDARR
jgi:PIN domain nuclease of toxin-antitoxin system